MIENNYTIIYKIKKLNFLALFLINLNCLLIKFIYFIIFYIKNNILNYKKKLINKNPEERLGAGK